MHGYLGVDIANSGRIPGKCKIDKGRWTVAKNMTL